MFNELYLLWAQNSKIEDLAEFMVYIYTNKYFDLFYTLYDSFIQKYSLIDEKNRYHYSTIFADNDKLNNIKNYDTINSLIHFDINTKKNIFSKKKIVDKTQSIIKMNTYSSTSRATQESFEIYFDLYKLNNKDKQILYGFITYFRPKITNNNFLYKLYNFFKNTNIEYFDDTFKTVINNYFSNEIFNYQCFTYNKTSILTIQNITPQFRTDSMNQRLEKLEKTEKEFKHLDLSEVVANLDLRFLSMVCDILLNPGGMNYWTNLDTADNIKVYNNYKDNLLEYIKILIKLYKPDDYEDIINKLRIQ